MHSYRSAQKFGRFTLSAQWYSEQLWKWPNMNSSVTNCLQFGTLIESVFATTIVALLNPGVHPKLLHCDISFRWIWWICYAVFSVASNEVDMLKNYVHFVCNLCLRSCFCKVFTTYFGMGPFQLNIKIAAGSKHCTHRLHHVQMYSVDHKRHFFTIEPKIVDNSKKYRGIIEIIP